MAALASSFDDDMDQTHSNTSRESVLHVTDISVPALVVDARRRYKRILRCAIVLEAGAFGLLALHVLFPNTQVMPFWISFTFLQVFAASLTFSLWLLPRLLIHRLATNEFRICPRCSYSLLALPTSGACPECGLRFTLDDLQRLWRSSAPRAGRAWLWQCLIR